MTSWLVARELNSLRVVLMLWIAVRAWDRVYWLTTAGRVLLSFGA